MVTTMPKLTLCFAAALLLSACVSHAPLRQEPQPVATNMNDERATGDDLAVRNEYLVTVQPDTSVASLAKQWAPLQVSIRFLGPDWTGVIVVSVAASISVNDAMAQLAAPESVIAVEPNSLVESMDDLPAGIERL